jgi:hypothetical protein
MHLLGTKQLVAWPDEQALPSGDLQGHINNDWIFFMKIQKVRGEKTGLRS